MPDKIFDKLTIVIPAYNEESSIAETIETVRKICPGSKILVVDDGSKDKTYEKAKRAGAAVIAHPKNRGYGAALKTGFRNASTDYMAFIDADLTYDPAIIPILLKTVTDEVDCAWGNRFGGKINQMPRIRKIGNRIISIIFFMATFKKVVDCSSGERVLRRSVLRKIDFDQL
ncbi:MAG: glycosyltransferase family 2 protein [Candidatus Aenigmarchaeota archaeon]|nr:glycosyltransferase family 2 protein [Candidatus Aenigmarchaeota archaeon]